MRVCLPVPVTGDTPGYRSPRSALNQRIFLISSDRTACVVVTGASCFKHRLSPVSPDFQATTFDELLRSRAGSTLDVVPRNDFGERVSLRN